MTYGVDRRGTSKCQLLEIGTRITATGTITAARSRWIDPAWRTGAWRWFAGRICSGASTTRRCPGDAVFFHGNTLHRSAQNLSRFRRWMLICCHNRVCNDTLVREDDRFFVPLEKVPDSAVLAAEGRFASGDEHFATRAFVPKVG